MRYLLLSALAAPLLAGSFAANAATTVTFDSDNPGGQVTLPPAGPGSVANDFSFDVEGTGDFTVTFTFTNPFAKAIANGSASFNFDPDRLVFTGGTFSSAGSTFAIGFAGGLGSSVQIDDKMLSGGVQTLTLTGRLNEFGTPSTLDADGNTISGNNFARVGGSLSLTSAVAAIPEPTTWALLILGFGAVGSALRRRNAAVRVSKAQLRFA